MIIKIAIGQLEALANDMITPFEHVPNGIDLAKRLDGAFRLLDEFTALIKSEIPTTTINDPLLLSRDAHECGHARISRTADEESLQQMRQ